MARIPSTTRRHRLFRFSTEPNILPGEEVDLKLTDTRYEELKTFLSEAGFSQNIKLVEVRVNTIGFIDGTAWFGKMLKRDGGMESN